MSAGASVTIGIKPTLIEVKPMRFLILDSPRQSNLHIYMKEMAKYHVTDIVRVCKPSYNDNELKIADICLHEMEFKDGTLPSKELVDLWLQLVEKTFYRTPPALENNACIAVHCVAGLGRAPQMVAIALIEFAGMDPVAAASFIRERRRGAINAKHLLCLEQYKKRIVVSRTSRLGVSVWVWNVLAVLVLVGSLMLLLWIPADDDSKEL